MSANTVEELVANGRYADAAARARAEGDLRRAAELYEQIWDFRAAAECARDAGDLGRALRAAIDARDEKLVRELTAVLESRGAPGRRIALAEFRRRRRFGDAAEQAEHVGELDQAVDLYRQGHRLLDAARLLEQTGRDQEAGRILERIVAHGGSTDELAVVHLQLGLLLSRHMSHDDAVRHLQQAAASAPTRRAARRALIAALAALGLHDAARDVLVAARQDDPELPVQLEDLVREQRSQRAALRDHAEPELIGGRYRVERLLGAGSAGRVYLARDQIGGRQVSVKVLHTVYARGRDAYQRFVREATVAGALRHPNLVEVLDFSAEQGFLVTEYLVGGPLTERLTPRLNGAAVRRLAIDVLAGLELAHRRSIIHRDVKPQNIFFDARGTAKLGDFGVAHLLDLGATQTGGLIGTLAYMSPEQITGAPLTFAADLYGLGVTLYQALTGRLPYLGPDFVAQHLGEAPPPPSSLADDISAGWDELLGRVLTTDPGDRFASVDEMRQALMRLEVDGPVGPRPLILPRAEPRAKSSPEAGPDDGPPIRASSEGRYQFETAIGRTEISTISRAVDRSLNRSVMIERFNQGAHDAATEARLYLFARWTGPFLQRVLSYDRDELIAVYEAPSGAPLTDQLARPSLGRRSAARLLKRLARAVAPLHQAGAGHGSLNASTIVVDEQGHPTVLACGLGAIPANASPGGDVAAIVDLIAQLVNAPTRTGAGLIAQLAEHLSAQERAALELLASPRTGEDLYTFADTLEVAILKGQLRG
jgi:eukaryotic-like serine/threonine-protein kinase